MPSAVFEFRFTGAGWAKARLQVGPALADLSASYLDDALGDLVRATAALSSGAEQVRVSWTEEPGEFRWILTARGRMLDVEILWFDKIWSDADDGDGQEVLRASCFLQSFCRAVAGAQVVSLPSMARLGTAQSGGATFPRSPSRLCVRRSERVDPRLERDPLTCRDERDRSQEVIWAAPPLSLAFGMTDDSSLYFLTSCFSSHCNRDWEHDLGIRIETLDNPDWALDVRIAETELERRTIPWRRTQTTEDDWRHWRSTGDTFEARRGPMNLPDALAAFEGFARREV